jgi:hypothetical protein
MMLEFWRRDVQALGVNGVGGEINDGVGWLCGQRLPAVDLCAWI